MDSGNNILDMIINKHGENVDVVSSYKILDVL